MGGVGLVPVFSNLSKMRLKAGFYLPMLYMPGKSVQSGNLLDNQTMKQIVIPILGKALLSEEFCPFGVTDNKSVNFAALSVAARTCFWMRENFQQRVQAVIDMRTAIDLPTMLWVSGPDAEAALQSFLEAMPEVPGLPDVRTAAGVAAVISPLHPSAPLMSRAAARTMLCTVAKSRAADKSVTALTKRCTERLDSDR